MNSKEKQITVALPSDRCQRSPVICDSGIQCTRLLERNQPAHHQHRITITDENANEHEKTGYSLFADATQLGSQVAKIGRVIESLDHPSDIREVKGSSLTHCDVEYGPEP